MKKQEKLNAVIDMIEEIKYGHLSSGMRLFKSMPESTELPLFYKKTEDNEIEFLEGTTLTQSEFDEISKSTPMFLTDGDQHIRPNN